MFNDIDTLTIAVPKGRVLEEIIPLFDSMKLSFFDDPFKSRKLIFKDKSYSLDSFNLFGEHNFKNYVSAIVASYLNGIDIEKSIESLRTFNSLVNLIKLKSL